MKNICSSFLSVLLLLCLFQGYVSAQNSYVLSGLSELTAFTSETTQEAVEDLTVIEPEGSEAIPESEIFKLADRVKQITGTLTLEGLTQLTTTIGLIDRIDCSQAGFVFKNCSALVDMDAFADEEKFAVINGDFIVDNCPMVQTGAATAHLDKSFSKMREVKGDLKLINITTAMNKPEKIFPYLDRVEGDFVIDGCTRLYYFTNGDNTANMPLTYIGGDLVLQNNRSLQRLNGFGTLKHLGGNVTILDNGAIPEEPSDDDIIGYCKIKYYEMAGILNENAVVQLGRTTSLVDFESLSPCPYEVVEDVNGTFRAVPANRFLSSIGMNTSINGRGENVNTTEEIMRYLGARWIRTSVGGSVKSITNLPDESSLGGGTSIASYKQLYENAGIRFSAGLGAGGQERNIPNLINNVKRIIEATSPDAIIAIEGNNEPNNKNWYVIFEGEIGGGKAEGQYNWKPVARMQRKLYEDVKADPVLGTDGYNYPVWSLTYGGASEENVGLQYLKVPEDDMEVPEEFRGVTFADVANLHNYFNHPSFKFPQNNQTWRAAEPGTNVPPGCDVLYRHFGVTWLNKYKGYLTDEELKALPRVTTETGAKIDGAVTEEMQGRLYLSLYLAQFARGFDYTAMYILSDRRDESGNQSFGFYDKFYTPRAAAHYLHNFTTILADDSDIEEPGELTYSITGRTITVHDLLLQKNDGTFELIVWGEKYEGGSDRVTVGFDQTYDEVWVYNPITGTNPEMILNNVNSIELDISNHPYIIEIGKHPELSVDELESDDFQIRAFPNPVIKNLTIYSDTEMGKVSLFNMMGGCVYTGRVYDKVYTIDMDRLPRGAYILTVFDEAGNCIKKEKVIKS
ncbi:T9SS type A sorting domain-containing protein [Barnesiella viscericola]|uniref:T9SS type A sorting domain-containing protein n=1 Tax=Barnesiella viscericola TaxID=397865 RepID=UPI00255B99BB|nr:T9SS type A sorting domain-containing protein [Barnesiella viscericola]